MKQLNFSSQSVSILMPSFHNYIDKSAIWLELSYLAFFNLFV